MKQSHSIAFFEIDETRIRVEIQSEKGALDQLEIGGLPPEGPQRDELVNVSLRHFLAEQAYRYEHKALKVRIAKFRAGLQAETAKPVEPKTSAAPPVLAELLIASLAPKNTAQAQLGDLHEMFEKNVARLGERPARQKYWIEVARSFGPLLWQWLKRVGLFTFLIDYFRSKFGL
ncbi:hypothetical protein WN73_23455 [Bradyrhizobium sp. CCBAU 45394]|uniref:permease prefix domain 2-containing transporter n=1 Tax=unclassified Bradyrhizobium TaxID=2631580 RepID=UPI002303AB95|nr:MULTISPECIES: permease prefix domain 2-containing transporter [unclassified Bradyrhizobium]MDA9393461.1 hypothetical protein [Bradyrhizobium sp. CCBAU 45394]MDA9538669.1 hypothetical protein [Bradyrhizobium sp. CCBAU 21362]